MPDEMCRMIMPKNAVYGAENPHKYYDFDILPFLWYNI